MTHNRITHAILVRAREILADPARWTRGEAARTKTGIATASSSEHATCFCTIGAMERARHELGKRSGEVDRAMQAFRDAIPPGRPRILISTFNDDPKTKHEDILTVLDTAILNMTPEPATP